MRKEPFHLGQQGKKRRWWRQKNQMEEKGYRSSLLPWLG